MGKEIESWAEGSEMVSFYEFYGDGRKIHGKLSERLKELKDAAIEDRVHLDYRNTADKGRVVLFPQSWLERMDWIAQVHENGAKSDIEIIEDLKYKYEMDKAADEQIEMDFNIKEKK